MPRLLSIPPLASVLCAFIVSCGPSAESQCQTQCDRAQRTCMTTRDCQCAAQASAAESSGCTSQFSALYACVANVPSANLCGSMSVCGAEGIALSACIAGAYRDGGLGDGGTRACMVTQGPFSVCTEYLAIGTDSTCGSSGGTAVTACPTTGRVATCTLSIGAQFYYGVGSSQLGAFMMACTRGGGSWSQH